jgi:predicted TPR repeat methyltransferase
MEEVVITEKTRRAFDRIFLNKRKYRLPRKIKKRIKQANKIDLSKPIF